MAERPSADRRSGPTLAVLGPCVIEMADTSGATRCVVPSQVQRRILTWLAFTAPKHSGPEHLIEAVWGESPPATARASLHNQVSRIRARFGAHVVETGPGGGYRLAIPTDSQEALRLLDDAERALEADDGAAASNLAEQGLRLWRGTPFGDLEDLAAADVARGHMAEAHRSLENLRLAGAIAVGRTAWAVPEAQRLAGLTPHDEQRWALLVRALDGAGRRGDALGTYEHARRILVSELGLAPGPELRAAELAVLGPEAVGSHGTSARLVGRSELVDRVLDLVGSHHDVLLVGETGGGRTRVLEEIRRRLRRSGATAAHSTCVMNPDTAVATLLELADQLGQPLDNTLPPATAFVAAVRQQRQDGKSLVLLVDDVDQAGPTSAAALAAAAEIDGVILVATATDATLIPSGLGHAHVEPVAPLDANDLAQLATYLRPGHPVDSTTLGWLTAMSGGNPLLVEYLLAEDSFLGATGDRRSNRSSPRTRGLHGLVRRRLERLGATTRTTLEHAAVCGEQCPAALLEHLAPREGIDAAITAGLLVEETDGADTQLRFRHGAIRSIVYDDLPPGRRMEVHMRAVTLLRDMGAPAQTIAPHALAVLEVDPLSAIELASAAATEAMAQGAHADAAQWYERCLAAATAAGPHGEHERVTALIRRGDELRLAGDPEHEAALFAAAEAAFALGDTTLIGDAAFAVLQLGATTETGSLHAAAVEFADRALAAVSDPDSHALVAGAASLTHSMNGNPDRCRDLFLSAEGSATSPTTRRRVLPFAYLGLGHPRDLELREQLTDELLALGREADDPIAILEGLQLSFSVGLQRCDGRRVRAAVTELEQHVHRIGDVGRRWALRYLQAAVAHLDGDDDATERLSNEALAVFSPVSPSRAFAVYGAQLLGLRIVQGRVEELVGPLEELVGEQPGVPAWHAALALGLVDADPTRARHHAVVALDDVPDDFTWLAAHLVGGRAAALVGDPATRARYAERLKPWSGLGCWQGTCSYGPVDTVLALLARADDRTADARRLAEAARQQAEALAAPAFASELDTLIAP